MVRTARLLHLSLLVGSTLAVLVLGLVRRVVAAPALSADTAALLRDALLVVAVGLVAGFFVFRARISASPVAPDDEFWRANLGTAIVTWALAEGLALSGAAVYYLTGDGMVAGVALLGLVLLVLARPGRLRGDSA